MQKYTLPTNAPNFQPLFCHESPKKVRKPHKNVPAKPTRRTKSRTFVGRFGRKVLRFTQSGKNFNNPFYPQKPLILL
ncbi:MAG: hypothetical protein J6M53_05105 [Bacteroidaceae bacterium]|nr:hypothetical protein [Bacteroidaceae bacterium]